MLFSITTLIFLLAAIAHRAVASPLLAAREIWNGMEVPPATKFTTAIWDPKRPLSGASDLSNMGNEVFEYLPDPQHFIVKIFAQHGDVEKDAKYEATVLNRMGKLKGWGISGDKRVTIVMNRVLGHPLDKDPEWIAAKKNPATKKAFIAKIAPKIAAVVLKLCKDFGIHHVDTHEGNIIVTGKDTYDLVDWGVDYLVEEMIHIACKCTDANLKSIIEDVTDKLTNG